MRKKELKKQLAEQFALTKSRIYIDVLVNGNHKTTYVIRAHRLDSISGLGDAPVSATGDGSYFKIDIPVVVS